MENEWFKFVSESKLQRESRFHPHVKGDCAEQFHAWDGGSTEMEYLTLIHSLVLASKPQAVLETGTSLGIGTLAIAAALKVNGGGKLWTLDVKRAQQARDLISSKGLETHVEFVTASSIEFLAATELQFELAFFDSDHGIRRREYVLASQRGCLKSSALCIFHDSSLMRWNVPTDEGYLCWLAGLPRLDFPKSRGLAIVQHSA